MDVYKGHRGHTQKGLDVMLYTKPIRNLLYLHVSSNHPTHIFEGIVKGELVRFLRNTSEKLTCLRRVWFLFTILSSKGYTMKMMRAALKLIIFRDRQKDLYGNMKPENDSEPFFVLPCKPEARAQ